MLIQIQNFLNRHVNTYYIDPEIEDPRDSEIGWRRADLSEIGLDTLPRNRKGAMFQDWSLDFVEYKCKKFQSDKISANKIFFDLMAEGLTDYEVFVHAGRAVWTNGRGQSYVEIFPTPQSWPVHRGWRYLHTIGNSIQQMLGLC